MKRDYFSRLRMAARWRLERREVEDVLSDYRDLMRLRSEEELLRDFGSPGQAIKVLSQPRMYYQWMAAFGIMAALLPLTLRFQLAAMVPALLLAVLWFRLRGAREEDGRFPRGIFPILAVQAVLLALVWVLIWFSLFGRNSDMLTLLENAVQPRNMGPLFYHSLRMVQGVALLSGLYGLVAARLTDRRWRVIYITGILLIALAGALISLLTWMDIPTVFAPRWYVPYLRKFIIITVVGLVGAGAGFC